MPSSGQRWSLGSATCCATIWPGAAALSCLPVYGNGDYPVQPIYVEDLAAQAVQAGSQSENSVADAAGPYTSSFEALLRLLASSMGACEVDSCARPHRWVSP